MLSAHESDALKIVGFRVEFKVWEPALLMLLMLLLPPLVCSDASFSDSTSTVANASAPYCPDSMEASGWPKTSVPCPDT